MLKMYQQTAVAGGHPEFWEENWREDRFAEAVRFCAIDPLRPLFERFAPPGARMLEGGCGQGQYVAFYADQGVHAIGVDFAQTTLRRLRAHRPDLPLCAADVQCLPFRASVFDVYYSGGVVEHFEQGPERALAEARRVLRPGGVLLASVPYFNPLRRALASWRRDRWRVVRRAEVDGEPPTDALFWQYAYRPAEFSQLLEAAGFAAIERLAYSVLWGFYDLPGLGAALAARLNRGPTLPSVVPPVEGALTVVRPSRLAAAARPSLLKRLVVTEDVRVPIAGLGIRVLRWFCANMMMFVGRKR
jgi:SAM-dependent methyltransferase